MKKNRMMRLAAILLVCVLLSTSVISGTFAKYTTGVSSEDAARVANWGFERSNSMDLSNLFLNSYSNVNSENGDDVIAPGTSGQVSFQFKYDEENGANGPEVAYLFTVKVESSCDAAILANENIQWALDSTTDANGDSAWGTWDELIEAITLLSGDASGSKQYAPNTLPEAFGVNDNNHTIYWRWVFSNSNANDDFDTAMGNDTDLADCSIKITITATQVD